MRKRKERAGTQGGERDPATFHVELSYSHFSPVESELAVQTTSVTVFRDQTHITRSRVFPRAIKCNNIPVSQAREVASLKLSQMYSVM